MSFDPVCCREGHISCFSELPVALLLDWCPALEPTAIHNMNSSLQPSSFGASCSQWHRRRSRRDTCRRALPHSLSFPHQPVMEFEGRQIHSADLVTMLEPFLTPERIARIDKLVMHRNYGVVPIVENTYDMGNLAAVCRTADAFGIGAVQYIKRSDEKFKQSARTSAGADKWLDVRVWDGTAAAIAAVKEAGFQLIVTHLSKSSITLQEVDFTRPTALVFGNEKFGATDEMVAAADHCAVIPMNGMVESLNISVAAAVCLYEAQQQRLRQGLMTGDLDTEERVALKAALMMRSVREPQTLINELLQRPPPPWQSGRLKATAAAAAAAAS